MARTSLSWMLALGLLSGSCSMTVSGLDDLTEDDDACDPRGRTELGTDLSIDFRGLTPHVNEELLMAVTVDVDGEAQVSSMAVLSTLEDPDLDLVLPKMLPAGPSEFRFWADSPPLGVFNTIEDDVVDHQWVRPVCPNGELVFTHTTPFQDISEATATGAVFRFMIPPVMRKPAIFDRFKMWVSATRLSDSDPSEDDQMLAFFRWAPFVAPPGSDEVPEQRDPPESFKVGDNVLGRNRGPIDTGALYRVEFVIDVDKSDDRSSGDFICEFDRERAEADGSGEWVFDPRLVECNRPSDFDLF